MYSALIKMPDGGINNEVGRAPPRPLLGDVTSLHSDTQIPRTRARVLGQVYAFEQSLTRFGNARGGFFV